MIDRSSQANVIAAVGKPTAEKRGQVSGSLPYRALGYDCNVVKKAYGEPLTKDGPYCRTVFFIDLASGVLETFFTEGAGYVEGHGVHIGMATADAERLLHMRVTQGCETNLYLTSKTASLTIAFEGGHVHLPNTAVVGGRVYAFVLHGRKHDAGVFDCL
jgi:hypothetical protein